jgi:S-adenosylmethionine synthetase
LSASQEARILIRATSRWSSAKDAAIRIPSLTRWRRPLGSAALSALVAREQGPWVVANDTSFAVGHAPPSRLEQTVLAVEQALTASSTIAAHPMIGEDVKV